MQVRARVAYVFLVVALSIPVVFGQKAANVGFALSQFDRTQDGCRAKGRLQDKDYCSSKIVDEVIARGKDSIPILISQLSGKSRTKQVIVDYWSYTTTGDIAFFLLTDLFTSDDGRTFNMPGVPNWDSVRQGCENETNEYCWRQYVRKHGIKAIQRQWSQAWNKNKDRVVWNPNTRYFRVTPSGHYSP